MHGISGIVRSGFHYDQRARVGLLLHSARCRNFSAVRAAGHRRRLPDTMGVERQRANARWWMTGMSVDIERLKATLGTPELRWLVDRLRRKLAQGRPLEGGVSLHHPTPAQRNALSRLFGRPASTADSIPLNLAKVERLLQESQICVTLQEAIEALEGPVRNLHEQQRVQEEQWQTLYAELLERVRDDGRLTSW